MIYFLLTTRLCETVYGAGSDAFRTADQRESNMGTFLASTVFPKSPNWVSSVPTFRDTAVPVGVPCDTGWLCRNWNAAIRGCAHSFRCRGGTRDDRHSFAPGSEQQKERWLPGTARGHRKIGRFGLTEPNHGSNPGGMETRAVKTPDGYELTGSKMWIGGGTLADVAIVWAKVDGEPGLNPASLTAVRGFLVERGGTPGFSASVIEGKYSLRVGITCRLNFDKCKFLVIKKRCCLHSTV